jgi:hypothetical protein
VTSNDDSCEGKSEGTWLEVKLARIVEAEGSSVG